MYDMNYPHLEEYARNHHAALLAEADKARLIKQTVGDRIRRQVSRTRGLHFGLRNILTVLTSAMTWLLG